MPIAIDAGSPALVSAGNVTTLSTASFTRPVADPGTYLVAMVMCTSLTAPVVTGGGLTWTRRVQNSASSPFAEIWTTPVTGSGSMTVTCTVTGSNAVIALKVDGVTGASPLNPVGNQGTGVSTTNAITPTGYTSSVSGSRGFFAAVEVSGAGDPTSSDTGFGWTAASGGFGGNISGIAVRKSANTAGGGTAVTFNADAAGSAAADWYWAALEIVPVSDVRSRTVMSRSASRRAASW